jgi:hypothetical protein
VRESIYNKDILDCRNLIFLILSLSSQYLKNADKFDVLAVRIWKSTYLMFYCFNINESFAADC